MSQARLLAILQDLQSGNAGRALREAELLAASMPQDEAARALLATCLERAGQPDRARGLLEELVIQFPSTWQHWNNLGNLRRAQGEPDAAMAAYSRALALQPEATRVRANYGLLLLSRGDYAMAAAELRRAADARDAVESMKAWAAIATLASGDEARGISLLQEWRRWAGLSDEVRLELASALIQIAETDQAGEILAQQFEDPEVRAKAMARRAMLHERLNQLDDADIALRELESAMVQSSYGDDVYCEYHHAKGTLAMRRRSYVDARFHLDRAWQLSRTPVLRASVAFALARALDRMDACTEAMHWAAIAHAETAIQRGRMQRQPERLPTLMRPFSGWKRRRMEGAHADDPSPLFIVGFPRSGTTLLEQMLGAHSSFESIDERPLLLNAVVALERAGLRYPLDLAVAPEEVRVRLLRAYWASANAIRRHGTARRLVDKNPLNMLALPMLAFLFPDAQVILCRRDPRDVVLSCHFQAFSDPELAALAADLPALAQSWRDFHHQFWTQARELSLAVQVVDYESLIQEPESTLARLAAWLKVESVSPMLAFASHARQRGLISTPSYAQVAEPLRRDSIGRWRPYAHANEELWSKINSLLADGTIGRSQ